MAAPVTSSSTPNNAENKAETGTTAYRVLARKYRPQTFDDLVGQAAMVRTLANAFETGRIAQAYMLTGVRGIGKTTTARLIARALNYDDKPSVTMASLGKNCQAILESRHVDVIEMDAATHNGVDDIREINDAVRYKPATARFKVYIIDEVHMLSKAAFNALLKTLEEPPEHVKFIFATTEIRKVPVTVLSRCQRFDLRRLDGEMLMGHLAKIAGLENVTADDEALRLIARAAEGSVRDGLSLLDQAIAYGDGAVNEADVSQMLGLVDRSRVITLFSAIMSGDAATALAEVEHQISYGADPQTVLADVAGFIHWVTKVKLVPSAGDDALRTEDERHAAIDFASRLSIPVLARAWQMMLKGLDEVATSPQPAMAAEMLLIRLAYASNLPAPAELVEKLRQSGRDIPAKPISPNKSEPAAQADPKPVASVSSVSSVTQKTSISDDTPQMAAAPVQLRQHAQPKQSDAKDAPALQQSAAPKLDSFQAVVDFVGQQRDIKLKGDLERFVRPVSITPGRIEVALEPDAPGNLANELARKLDSWTGTRWIVLVVNDGGEKTLIQQRREERAGLFSQARTVPAVKTALEIFPGAEILEVSDIASLTPQGENTEDNDDKT